MLPLLSRRTSEQVQAPRLYWLVRLLMACLGLGLLTLLGLSAWLSPSPTGFGTHQQLGLPPCTVTELFEIRCPSCGMTTSWAHTVRGQLPSAVRANAGGMLLALLALLLAPWSLASAARGRWVGGRPSDNVVVILSLLVIVVTLADWIIRLWIR